MQLSQGQKPYGKEGEIADYLSFQVRETQNEPFHEMGEWDEGCKQKQRTLYDISLRSADVSIRGGRIGPRLPSGIHKGSVVPLLAGIKG